MRTLGDGAFLIVEIVYIEKGLHDDVLRDIFLKFHSK